MSKDYIFSPRKSCQTILAKPDTDQNLTSLMMSPSPEKLREEAAWDGSQGDSRSELLSEIALASVESNDAEDFCSGFTDWLVSRQSRNLADNVDGFAAFPRQTSTGLNIWFCIKIEESTDKNSSAHIISLYIFGSRWSLAISFRQVRPCHYLKQWSSNQC